MFTLWQLLSPHFFKKAMGKLLSPPSVCASIRLLCYLLLNHWTKYNQIWCVSYSHEWGAQRKFIFWPPGEGSKGQISLISNTKSISKIFIPNFVCVLKMKDTKHIRWDFYTVSLVMPQGWDFGALGHIKSTGMTSRTECN